MLCILLAAAHLPASAPLPDHSALPCAPPRPSQTCLCAECKARAEKEGGGPLQHTPTEFERHSGMAASKKWKYTVRVLTPRGTITLGQWLDGHGIQSKYTRWVLVLECELM